MNLAQMREDYRRQSLNETDLAPDPFSQFQHWFNEAVNAQLPEPNAMVLATVNAAGQPAARVVLMKELSEQGVVFFSNYHSRKGHELAANPQVALLFYWAQLERQVRIEGWAEPLGPEASAAYFQQRPRGSQIGALASPQSQVIPDRKSLEEKFAELEMTYADQPIPCPEHWGGYRVQPVYFEFWQGRSSRLHDRLVYKLDAKPEPPIWVTQRLAP